MLEFDEYGYVKAQGNSKNPCPNCGSFNTHERSMTIFGPIYKCNDCYEEW